MLPIFIPKSFFDAFNSVISSCIWKGKHPRLNKAYLQRSNSKGGLAMPNFRFYYWAATLQCLAFWFHYLNQDNYPYGLRWSWTPQKTFPYSVLFLITICSNPLCKTLVVWNGTVHFKALFVNNCFLSFKQLSAQYTLSKAHFFRYQKIRHFLQSQLPNFPDLPDTNMADSVLSLNPTHKCLISVI